MKKFLRFSLIGGTCLAVLAVLTILITNAIVLLGAKLRIVKGDEIPAFDPDCILILGCGVREDGTPSNMLEDRLLCGIALYHSGVADKLLMSGDHGRDGYNEVGVMKDFAIAHGVPAEDIFMDHAGFSTYESLYRAKAIFEVERAVVVTQTYHLSRALHIADSFGIEAYGVGSDPRVYYGQWYRDVREILARTKDAFTCLLKPPPTYLGETIPVSGNGNLTND